MKIIQKSESHQGSGGRGNCGFPKRSIGAGPAVDAVGGSERAIGCFFPGRHRRRGGSGGGRRRGIRRAQHGRVIAVGLGFAEVARKAKSDRGEESEKGGKRLGGSTVQKRQGSAQRGDNADTGVSFPAIRRIEEKVRRRRETAAASPFSRF